MKSSKRENTAVKKAEEKTVKEEEE